MDAKPATATAAAAVLPGDLKLRPRGLLLESKLPTLENTYSSNEVAAAAAAALLPLRLPVRATPGGTTSAASPLEGCPFEEGASREATRSRSREEGASAKIQLFRIEPLSPSPSGGSASVCPSEARRAASARTWS